MPSHNPAIKSLQRFGYHTNTIEVDRDIRRVSLVSATSGRTLIVLDIEHEPDFLDVTYVREVACRTIHDELALRRALDIDAQDNPFVKTSLDVTHETATVTYGITHDLPVANEERAALADRYVAALLMALESCSPTVERGETKAA